MPSLHATFCKWSSDLQTLGRHTEALALLEKLRAGAETKSLQRELLYWRADSHAALGQDAEAGELYLRSAVFNGGNGDDPWGQTALFHVATVLARAGMTTDARHIYTALLKSTPDPARRAQIERQLQQLWLSGSRRGNRRALRASSASRSRMSGWPTLIFLPPDFHCMPRRKPRPAAPAVHLIFIYKTKNEVPPAARNRRFGPTARVARDATQSRWGKSFLTVNWRAGSRPAHARWAMPVAPTRSPLSFPVIASSPRTAKAGSWKTGGRALVIKDWLLTHERGR